MPRTGRPLKGVERKDQSLQLRLSKGTMDKLNACCESYKKNRTEIVELGIDILFKKIQKK